MTTALCASCGDLRIRANLTLCDWDGLLRCPYCLYKLKAFAEDRRKIDADEEADPPAAQ